MRRRVHFFTDDGDVEVGKVDSTDPEEKLA